MRWTSQAAACLVAVALVAGCKGPRDQTPGTPATSSETGSMSDTSRMPNTSAMPRDTGAMSRMPADTAMQRDSNRTTVPTSSTTKTKTKKSTGADSTR